MDSAAVPLDRIDTAEYREDGSGYGIAILVRKDTDLDEAVLSETRQQKGCDLYLPYFSERSLISLQEHLHALDDA